MDIIAEAKATSGTINSRNDLLQKQLEMLKTIYEHHAISEAEYKRSSGTLIAKMQARNSI